MKITQTCVVVASLFLITGCLGSEYQAPKLSGLEEIRRYPNPDDVCVSLSANEVTRSLTKKTSGLIGCPTHEKGAIKDRISENFAPVGVIDGWTILHNDLLSAPTHFQAIPDYLKGRTVMFHDSFHRTQLAYYTQNNREWLWYPGNSSALLGHVEIRANQICFRYPNSSINPATGVSGPDWECSLLSSHRANIVDSVPGDIFNLSSGRIPFVMKKKHYSFDELNIQISEQ